MNLKTTACYILLSALLSCSNDIDTPVQEPKLKVYQPSESKFDSALFYFQMQVDYLIKSKEAELEYLRTGKDRYRVQGNRYIDSSHYWYLRLQKESGGHITIK